MSKHQYTALYERRSRDDELQGVSNSITNPKRLWKIMLRSMDLTIFDTLRMKVSEVQPLREKILLCDIELRTKLH